MFDLMGKGIATEIAAIKAMPILEFWNFYDNFMKRVKQETDLNKLKTKR